MGLDPATMMLIGGAASAAGPVLANVFAPEGQELSPFRGNTDPQAMLGRTNELMNMIGQAVADRAASPISLPSSFVQQPGAYTGGGLPMPIGLVASDPALANPSLLSLPGMEQFRDIFGRAGQPSGPGGNTSPGGDIGNGDPTGPPDGEPAAFSPNTGMPSSSFASTITPAGRAASAAMDAGPRRRSASCGNLVRAADLMEDSGGTADLDQGYGAAQLLLEAIRGGATQRTGAMI